MTRLILSSLVLTLGVGAASASAQSAAPVYTQVASIDLKADGQPFRTFAFDARTNRLYGGSDRGLFWVSVADDKPVWKGPLFKKDITHIEFAPELNRVFFITLDEVGYANADNLAEPRLMAKLHASDMAYEPTKREVYVTTRAPKVFVFDATTGERGATIDLDGWLGLELEAVPGKVFLLQGKTPGIFSIDAATHTLSKFTTSGKVVTPAHIEADPAGRYIFASYYQNIVAIDAANGNVLGRVTTPFTSAIAYDPGTSVLVATWRDDPEPVRVGTFRVDAAGLTPIAEMKNPRAGALGVEPTSHGFIQLGMNRLYIWSSKSN